MQTVPAPELPIKVGDRYLNNSNGMEVKISAITQNYLMVHFLDCAPFLLTKQNFIKLYEKILEGKGKNSFIKETIYGEK
jgi:hypothetical protein